MIEQYEAVGHAVRALYNYSGMADVAMETHDADYRSAVKSLWDNVVNRKYYVTGGVGSGETSEGAWHSVPCCVGNIPRTLLSMPRWMYSKGPDGIFVNLFVGSTVTVDNVRGTDVQLVQHTNYPWDGKVAITVNPTTAKQFAMRIRVLNRQVSGLYASSPDANGITSIKVNGSVLKPKIESGYALVERTWRRGDRIELELPMRVQRVRAVDAIAADQGKVALRYGPLVYNIEKVDVGDVAKVLAPDAPLTTEWRGDLLNGVMVIKGQFADGSAMLAIPNYARMNREPAPPTSVAAVPPTGGPPGARPAPPPVVSVVWISERTV